MPMTHFRISDYEEGEKMPQLKCSDKTKNDEIISSKNWWKQMIRF